MTKGLPPPYADCPPMKSCDARWASAPSACMHGSTSRSANTIEWPSTSRALRHMAPRNTRARPRMVRSQGRAVQRPESLSDRRTPKVTVVIPVYNRAQAVRRAIASVLAQTFQDFEIVVVDDGSTDDSVRSVESFDDPRIRMIRHEGNLGGSVARNTGITAAVAPYVAFLDSDD